MRTLLRDLLKSPTITGNQRRLVELLRLGLARPIRRGGIESNVCHNTSFGCMLHVGEPRRRESGFALVRRERDPDHVVHCRNAGSNPEFACAVIDGTALHSLSVSVVKLLWLVAKRDAPAGSGEDQEIVQQRPSDASNDRSSNGL